MIEPTLALTYPTAQVLYFRKDDADLVRRVELGLKRARADGSFQRLFEAFHRPSIERAHTAGRRGMSLANPLLPKGFALDELPRLEPLK
jgi:hypothetical protein